MSLWNSWISTTEGAENNQSEHNAETNNNNICKGTLLTATLIVSLSTYEEIMRETCRCQCLKYIQ